MGGTLFCEFGFKQYTEKKWSLEHGYRPFLANNSK